MNQQTINILVWISPLLIGGIIAVVNSEEVNNATEKAEAWSRRTQSNASKKKSSINRYLINPVFYTLVAFSDWTDSFIHRGLKNGIRVAATLYLIAVWCFLIYAAFMIAIFLVIVVVVIYVGYKILGMVLNVAVSSDSNFSRGYNATRNVIGSGGSGTRTNPESGIIQEKGFLGWQDTDARINPETGQYQKKGFLGWNDTETRIDQGTGNIQKKGFLGYNDTDTRINQETGEIEKKEFLGWQGTDERIDPVSGKHQKKGLIGWLDD